MNYKSILTGLLIWACGSMLLADLPGGYNMYSANFSVRDENNSPKSGIHVKLEVWTYTTEYEIHTVNLYGTTNSQGGVYLQTLIPPELSESLYSMTARMIDTDYSIIQSSNTWTNSQNYLNPYFKIVYDRDKDLVNDNLEQQLAEKFSPVLHKHYYDLQEGLSNVDWILSGRSSLKAFNYLGQEAYNSTITSPDQIHATIGSADRDSNGKGEMTTYWILDINDAFRFSSAPTGERPLYYHVYQDENGYFYIQYWYFLAMNDVSAFTNNSTWHEGDFEHVTIKVDPDQYPVAVNFYRHEGGRTILASDAWWSSSNANSYNDVQVGYSSQRNHLHVWLAANSHGSYNRFESVYKLEAEAKVDFCTSLDDESFTDNVDYDGSSHDLYFQYDYLENLGEIQESPLKKASNGFYYNYAHGMYWLEHFETKGTISKIWLPSIVRFGTYWGEACGMYPIGSSVFQASPFSPFKGQTHEWNAFSIELLPGGFGNTDESHFMGFATKTITWVTDPVEGD
ncbi:MAG: hypothetical protein H6696_12935 [Deferribacteres bacterium]|nr:hypothetical protein [candidate division KSB1 bacterium]MCB9502834.1 hypothetical protein [Deferribacteres bacterium]